MKKTQVEPPVVRVSWLDAWFDSEQPIFDEWRAVYPVVTVGFLVRDTTDVVSVAAEILPEGDGYRAVTHIPRVLVTSVDELREGKRV